MEKLIEIIQKLKTDVYAAITVIDKRNPLQKVVTDHTGEMLMSKYGSIENFFETIHKDGVKDVIVMVRRKNGSVFKADSKYNPIEMSFEPKAGVQTQTQPLQPAQNNMSWLTGGLNQADAIYKMMDHTRLVQEVEKLAAKNEILEKDNKELREKNLRNEVSSSNSAANNELFKTIAPLLMPLVTKVVGGGAVSATGLNQPELSPIKQSFWQIANASDDDTLSFMISIIQKFGNPDFVSELENLIQKYDGGN